MKKNDYLEPECRAIQVTQSSPLLLSPTVGNEGMEEDNPIMNALDEFLSGTSYNL